MKKKVLILLVVAVLAIAPAMAASRGSSDDGSFGIGINLGTNTGLGMKFGMGKFDVIANIGIDALHIGSNGIGLGGDVGFNYEVYDIDIKGPHHMPVTLGLMIPMVFFFGDPFNMNLGVVLVAGLEYQIPDVPLLFYLRLGGGIDLEVTNEWRFDGLFNGGIGALWMFD